MNTVIGRAFDTLAGDHVDRNVDELLSLYGERVVGSETVVVLPDASYPFHPSTGLVTNPAVVAAAVRSLRWLVDPDRLVVAVPGSSWSAAEQVSTLLGYPGLLEGTAAELVHLDEVETRARPSGDGRRTLAVPSILEEGTVVNVPTLRRSAALGMVAGLGNLALTTTTDPTPEEVAFAAEAIDPALTLLDGTYVFCGTPSRPTFLLASDDAVALDQVGAALLGLDGGAVPYLDEPSVDVASSLEGVRLRSLHADIRRGEPIEGSDEPSGLMVAGYRLYSRLSGDVLPPQFLGGVDG